MTVGVGEGSIIAQERFWCPRLDAIDDRFVHEARVRRELVVDVRGFLGHPVDDELDPISNVV